MSKTIKDIARLAGVSTATVSRVLNNQEVVKERTRQKVMSIVRKNDFVLNQSAKVLKERKSHTIGVIAANLLSSFNAEIIKGIEAAAADKDYRCLVCDCNNIHNKLRDEQERHYIRILGGGTVDGIILLHTHLTQKDFSYYKSKKINLSVFGINLEEQGVPSIMVDNVLGSYLAVKHLCEHGYKRIGFIFGHQRIAPQLHRLEGYRKALHEFGISEHPDYAVDGEFSIKGGANAFRKLLALKNPPDAIFCANDDMALGSMKAARELNILVPEDVAIIGYDDIITCELTTPRLTSIRQPKETIGNLLFEKLHSQMNKKNARGQQNECTILTPELIIRESCGCEK